MSKYGARKVIIDDITFDSIAEGEFYLLLKKMRENEEIKEFEIQPTFELQPKYKSPDGSGKTIRSIKYIADFRITYPDDRIEVVDIKGFPTTDFKLKKKMFEYKFGVPLIVLKYTKKNGFVDWDEYEKQKRLRKKASKNIEI